MARSSSARRTPRSPLAIGVIAARRDRRRSTFLGFTKDIPFTTPSRSGRRSSRRTRSGPARRCGSPASTSARSKTVEPVEDTDTSVVVAGDQRAGPADPRGRDGQDPPAHLPRGQLLRRPQAGHAGGRRELDDGDTIKVTQTASPVQLDEVLTALQSDTRQDLKDVLGGLGHGAEQQAVDGRRHGRRPLGPRRDRRRVLQRRLPRHPRRRALDRAGVRGVPRPGARRGPVAADRRGGEDLGRADAQRGAAPGPGHELQHDDGRVRVGVRQPADVDPRAGADARRPPTARSRRSTRRSRRRARSRARSCPASARRRPRSTRRSRGSSRPACSSARRSWAGWRRSCRPRRATWRG